jgi:hypothetical protein
MAKKIKINIRQTLDTFLHGPNRAHGPCSPRAHHQLATTSRPYRHRLRRTTKPERFLRRTPPTGAAARRSRVAGRHRFPLIAVVAHRMTNSSKPLTEARRPIRSLTSPHHHLRMPEWLRPSMLPPCASMRATCGNWRRSPNPPPTWY